MQKWFLSFLKVFATSCLYWNMLNVPTVQRALAGKCLIKLTINSSSFWSASCFLCVFSQFITGRGVDCLMEVSWLRGRGWFRCPFYDLMLLNKTLWVAVTCCDLMDRRIIATFDHDHSKNVMQYKNINCGTLIMMNYCETKKEHFNCITDFLNQN